MPRTQVFRQHKKPFFWDYNIPVAPNSDIDDPVTKFTLCGMNAAHHFRLELPTACAKMFATIPATTMQVFTYMHDHTRLRNTENA